MKYYSIGKFSEMVGKSIQTLRIWDDKGILKPSYISRGGHRMYSEDLMYQVLNIGRPSQERKTIGYCRVSTAKQKDDLARQIDAVKQYMIAKGYNFEIIEDVGSGINYGKKGLNQLIDSILKGEVERVVVLYKDRLVRFGIELIEGICKRYGVKVEVIDSTPRTEEQELVEDLIQIVTVFSCKLQGKRANKAKKILKEVMELDKVDENSC
jgi:predicted site-specific integrase-resolvase